MGGVLDMFCDHMFVLTVPFVFQSDTIYKCWAPARPCMPPSEQLRLSLYSPPSRITKRGFAAAQWTNSMAERAFMHSEDGETKSGCW